MNTLYLKIRLLRVLPVLLLGFVFLAIDTKDANALICTSGVCFSAPQHLNAYVKIEGGSCQYISSYSCNGDPNNCQEDHIDVYSDPACTNLVWDDKGCCGDTPPPSTPPEDNCEECDPSCPAPLTSIPTLEELKLEKYGECENEGDCDEDKSYIDCYEPYDNRQIPTASLVIHPNATPTSLGFSSSTHTGKIQNQDRVNEPIRMTATYSDANGSDDIEAMYVWMQISGSTPNTPQYLSSTTGLETKTYTNNSFGFMMRKENSNWIPYIPSQGVSDKDKWVAASYSNNSFVINGQSGGAIARIYVNSITPNGNSIVLDFNISFDDSSEPYVDSSAYNIFVMANDVFGFTPYDNYQEGLLEGYWDSNQIRDYNHWTDSSRDWRVDLQFPSINSLSIRVLETNRLEVSWDVADGQSIYAIVGNVYALDNLEEPTDIDFYDTDGLTINPTFEFDYQGDRVIGHLTDGYAFKMENINSTSKSNSIVIDTKTNRGGEIAISLTVFDYGGNVRGEYSTYDLRDWMITRGGFVYSSQGIGFDVKALDPGLWSLVSSLNSNNFFSERADLSTELYHDFLSNPENPLERASTNLAYYINRATINLTKDSDSFYTTLLPSLIKKIAGVENKEEVTSSNLSGDLCSSGDCSRIFYRLPESDGVDLIVNQDFNCNAKGIFFVSGDLTLTPNITNSNYNSDACIFMVKGNVTVNAGSDKPGNEYDEINAFIVADGRIIISEDSEGLLVKGGLVGLGGDSKLPMIMQRYLDLSDRGTLPVLAVLNHPKYGIFSKEVLSNFFTIVKTEVGFKPF